MSAGAAWWSARSRRHYDEPGGEGVDGKIKSRKRNGDKNFCFVFLFLFLTFGGTMKILNEPTWKSCCRRLTAPYPFPSLSYGRICAQTDWAWTTTAVAAYGEGRQPIPPSHLRYPPSRRRRKNPLLLRTRHNLISRSPSQRMFLFTTDPAAFLYSSDTLCASLLFLLCDCLYDDEWI